SSAGACSAARSPWRRSSRTPASTSVRWPPSRPRGPPRHERMPRHSRHGRGGPMSYYTPQGGLPAQTELLTDRAIVTEAYTVIPKGVLRDIVTSRLPGFTSTRSWILARPIAGFATTFSQLIVEIGPGGGADWP